MRISELPIDVIVGAIDTNLLFHMTSGEMFLRRWTYMKTKPMPLENCSVYEKGLRPGETSKVLLTTIGIDRDKYVIDYKEHDPL